MSLTPKRWVQNEQSERGKTASRRDAPSADMNAGARFDTGTGVQMWQEKPRLSAGLCQSVLADAARPDQLVSVFAFDP